MNYKNNLQHQHGVNFPICFIFSILWHKISLFGLKQYENNNMAWKTMTMRKIIEDFKIA